MARQKGDGLGRIGGRKKGTPNKATGNLRGWLKGFLESNTETFENDLKSLTPYQRLTVVEKLFSYAIPRLQSVDPVEQRLKEMEKLEEILETAPEEAINKIVEIITRLKNEQD